MLGLDIVVDRLDPRPLDPELEGHVLAPHATQLPAEIEPDPLLSPHVAGHALAPCTFHVEGEHQARALRLRKTPAEAHFARAPGQPEPELRRPRVPAAEQREAVAEPRIEMPLLERVAAVVGRQPLHGVAPEQRLRPARGRRRPSSGSA